MAVAAREGPMAIVEQPIVNGTVGIIEDDPGIRDLVATLLVREGFEVLA
jgi:hypothetical protein